MKLFIIAGLIAVSAAARLEHLERGYLPPDQAGSQGGFGARGSSGNGFGSNGNGFGSNGNGFGAKSGASSFHSGAFGATSNSATSNQYLPPDHEHSESGSFGGFGAQSPAGSGSFASQRSQPSQQYGAPSNQFGAQAQSPSSQYGAPSSGFGSASNGFGQQSAGFGQQSSGFGHQSGGFGHKSGGFGQQSGGFGQQSGSFGQQSQGSFAAANRQYLAPKTGSSFQNIPQQAFDEQTGYHY